MDPAGLRPRGFSLAWLIAYILFILLAENQILCSRNKKFPDPGELAGDCLPGGSCKDMKSECNSEDKCDCEPGFVPRVLDVSFVGDMGYSACFVADGEKCVSGLLEASIPQAAFLYNREEYNRVLFASKGRLADFITSHTDEFGRKLTDVNVIASYVQQYEAEVKAIEKLNKEGVIGRPSKDYGCGSGVCHKDGTCGTGNKLRLLELDRVDSRFSKQRLKTSGQQDFRPRTNIGVIWLLIGFWTHWLGG